MPAEVPHSDDLRKLCSDGDDRFPGPEVEPLLVTPPKHLMRCPSPLAWEHLDIELCQTALPVHALGMLGDATHATGFVGRFGQAATRNDSTIIRQLFWDSEILALIPRNRLPLCDGTGQNACRILNRNCVSLLYATTLDCPLGPKDFNSEVLMQFPSSASPEGNATSN